MGGEGVVNCLDEKVTKSSRLETLNPEARRQLTMPRVPSQARLVDIRPDLILVREMRGGVLWDPLLSKASQKGEKQN